MRRWLGLGLLVALWPRPLSAEPADPALQEAVRGALRSATAYFQQHIARHGGYAYYTSADLRQRWGEGRVGPDTILVQPPGTPTVGLAYLAAYAATGEEVHRQAARAAAEALCHGQLESGGWTQVVHFAPPASGRLGQYRHGRPAGTWNASSLDDGQTQAALQLLIRADQALGFGHREIHTAALAGLDGLLQAQYPNGAFPQVWLGPVAAQPVLRARFPDYDWRTVGRVKEYWTQYTLNDNLAGTVADVLIAAHQTYGEARFQTALERLGSFLILAQMPLPQPAWCQQYSFAMVPIWARRFEPPAITGWESQDVLETLLKIARYTGRREYLEPIPRALDYLRQRVLPDGRLARFYELRTDRPLFMDGQYQLTYDDTAAPSHYGWKQPSRLAAIEQAYQAVRAGEAAASSPPPTAAEVRRILAELDPPGRWVSTFDGEALVGQPPFERGFRYLSSAVFSHHLVDLSRYLSLP